MQLQVITKYLSPGYKISVQSITSIGLLYDPMWKTQYIIGSELQLEDFTE